MVTLTPVENDIVKKVARCLRVSQKRFGCIAPVGWSNSNSDFEKNDTKAINTKRLSLSFASDSKCFKRAKTKEIGEAKKSYPPANMKRNTNWAVKAFQTWWGCHNSTAEEKDEMCPEDAQTTNHFPSNINFNWAQRTRQTELSHALTEKVNLPAYVWGNFLYAVTLPL